MAVAGERGPLWLLADEQLSGRGRFGRQWVSAPGNLYCTFILPTDATPATIPQLAFVVALAVHDTIASACGGAHVKLKWPNDCLLDVGKVAGILCETLGQGVVAIGCGINVAHAPQGLAYATSFVRQKRGDIAVADIFASYRQNFAARLAQWNNGTGIAAILSDWQDRAQGLNAAIEVKQGENLRRGVFLGLAPDGALRLQKPDGTIENVYAGDVSPSTH